MAPSAHGPAPADPASTDAKALVLKCFTKVPNAGDAYSARLAAQWFGRPLELVGKEPQARDNLLLVGSILQWADAHSTVCGAGFVSDAMRLAAPPQRIVLTRGPRTDAMLRAQGVTAPGRHGDPGVLAPRLFAPAAAVPGRIGLVPHYVDADDPWLAACRDRGVAVIDPTQPLDDYFAALQACEVILATSLHGLVFAHAYGRPALWIELGQRILGNGFKYYDYYASLGVGQDRVRRHVVQPGDDPLALAVDATAPAVGDIAANVEEALHALHPGRWA